MTDQQPTDTDKLLSVLDAAERAAVKNLLEKVAKEGHVPSAHEQKMIDKVREKATGGNGGGENAAPQAPEMFKNAFMVASWLKETGWAIGKSRVYGHIKEGKLRPDLPDGAFSRKAVERYAATHLTMARSRMKLKDEDIQRRKLMAEIAKTEAEARRAVLKLAVDEGRYVLLEDVDRRFAGRAVLMDTMRQASIMNHAAERVAMVGGDPDRVADLIAMDMAHHTEEMNLFASWEEFTVILKANNEEISRQDAKNAEEAEKS